jgi:hypothetical protein
VQEGEPHALPVGKTQAPVVSQSVAPQAPVVGEQAAAQQWPVPETPQTALAHSPFDVHGIPAFAGATHAADSQRKPGAQSDASLQIVLHPDWLPLHPKLFGHDMEDGPLQTPLPSQVGAGA